MNVIIISTHICIRFQRRKGLAKVHHLVSTLREANVYNRKSFVTHWSSTRKKFLYSAVKLWFKKGHAEQAKKIWLST